MMIRHGESAAQLSGLVSGHETCLGLSDAGRAQAHHLARRFAEHGELGDGRTWTLHRHNDASQLDHP